MLDKIHKELKKFYNVYQCYVNVQARIFSTSQEEYTVYIDGIGSKEFKKVEEAYEYAKQLNNASFYQEKLKRKIKDLESSVLETTSTLETLKLQLSRGESNE